MKILKDKATVAQENVVQELYKLYKKKLQPHEEEIATQPFCPPPKNLFDFSKVIS